MNQLPRSLVVSVLGAWALLAGAPASAATTYTYTAPINACANNYVGWFYNYACNALDGSGIRIEFTTAAPLVSVGGASVNAPVTSQVLGWKFQGGAPFLNLDSHMAGVSFSAALTTNALGQVLDHQISIGGAIVIPTLETSVSSVAIYSTYYDQETVTSNYLRQSSGIDPYNGYQPHYASLSEGITSPLFSGTWTTTSAVPEPGTVVLMLLGLAGIAGAAEAEIGQARRSRQASTHGA